MPYSAVQRSNRGAVCALGGVFSVAVVLGGCIYRADQRSVDVGTGDGGSSSVVDAWAGFETSRDPLNDTSDVSNPDWGSDQARDRLSDGATHGETSLGDASPSETRDGPSFGLDTIPREAGADSVLSDGPPTPGLDSSGGRDLRNDDVSKDTTGSDADGATSDTPVPDAPPPEPEVSPPVPPPCAGQSQKCSDGQCHDLKTDNAHCGSCQHPCTGGQACSNGSCACATGTISCGATCTNTTFDPQNCGGCGQSCDGGLVCTGGACATSCVNSVLCGDRCTDLNTDSAHCGSCGHPCAFADAHAYCEGGTCHLGACQPGHGNPDGDEANGCECAVTNGGIEVCDGVDNDCNGLVDFTIEDGLPAATCQCQQQILTVASATPQCGQLSSCAIPQCLIGSGGQEMALSYALSACTAPYPWAQCAFSSVYLNAFDADQVGAGVLEIYLCIDGPQAGQKMNGVGIYYGAYPGRKHFSFFTQQELSQGVSAGCYTRHFRPSDADCPPEDGLPATCRSNCTDGKWGAGHPECVHDYDDVPFWVTAETCQGTSATATIQHVQVRYLTGQVCTCQTDSDCRDPNRPHCNPSSKVCVAL